MKITARKIKFAWNNRRLLWRYRRLIGGAYRNRHGIAGGLAAAGAMIAAGVLAHRVHRA